MKEIIYIQAGKLSNYAGTHFWNTQETYAADDSANTLYDLDVSFREGLSRTGRPTYCPRLLIFDYKCNFGTLAETNALLGTNEDVVLDEDSSAIWNGQVSEYRQEAISKSSYHSSLDTSDDSGHADKTCDAECSDDDSEIRYWSDFSRVYYIPRTVQKIPDPAEWEDIGGDWNGGNGLFSHYDEVITRFELGPLCHAMHTHALVEQEYAVMEGSLRLFLEECDSPQGLQIMNDTSTFGGFMNGFLTSFRDQYTKLPCLVAPLLSNGITTTVEIDNLKGIGNVISDALYLRSLDELASMGVPIQPSDTWPAEAWQKSLSVKPNDMYHDSAILSALLETATIPLRLKDKHATLASLSGKLNWRGTTPFCDLSGVFPFTTSDDFDLRLANLSARRSDANSEHSHFARWDVTRGFTPIGLSAYQSWSSVQSLEDTFVTTVQTAAYPIPTSFPAFFKNNQGASAPRKGIFSQPESCGVFSSLSTGSSTAALFSSYASAIETYLKKKPALEALGFDGDELRDLVNNLWTLHDSYASEADEDTDVSSVGEDEEY